MDFVPIFVANGFYKNRSEFKREHVVYSNFTKFPKIDRYINQGRLIRHRSQILVHMEYERHTRRKRVEVELPYDKQMLERVLKDRWNVYTDRPLRDVGEMFQAARRVVNSDPSRLEMVCELWEKHPRLIIFYNFNYELESLRSLAGYYGLTSTPTGYVSSTKSTGVDDQAQKNSRSLSTQPTNKRSKTCSPVALRLDTSRNAEKSFAIESNKVSMNSSNGGASSSMQGIEPSMSTVLLDRLPTTKSSFGLATDGDPTESSTTVSIAEWNGHKHEPVPTTDRWLYFVQYTAGAEAWNCTTTDAMIMYSLNYSWKVTEQSEGRIDRMNTLFHDLWYYRFMSDSWIDKAIMRALQAKQTFNESKFKGLFPS